MPQPIHAHPSRMTPGYTDRYLADLQKPPVSFGDTYPQFPDIPDDLIEEGDVPGADYQRPLWRGDPLDSYTDPLIQEDIITRERAAERLAVTGQDYVTAETVQTLRAQKILAAGGISCTTLVEAPGLVSGVTAWLKLETEQVGNSYKSRGSYYALSQLSPEQLAKGVVAASAGNHAIGVAHAAAHFKARATVFMPIGTPQKKQEKVLAEGANIKLVEGGYEDSYNAAVEYAAQNGDLPLIPAFDHPDVITGASTIAAELLQQADGISHIFVPCGGGGLSSGIARYIKQNRGNQIKVIGVEYERQDAMAQSLRLPDGESVRLPTVDSWAEGTAVRQVGKLPLKLNRQYLDEVIVIQKADVAQAMIELNELGTPVEPAGAMALAGLRNYIRKHDEVTKPVVMCSGNNFDASKLREASQIVAEASAESHYITMPDPHGRETTYVTTSTSAKR